MQSSLETVNAVNLEFFYWVSIALMFAIHAGFLVYEAGASRVKNVLASAMKNLMTLAVVIPTFFFAGWFIYNSMVTGVPRLNPLAEAALPWSANMGPNLSDSLSGVFWGCFALFSATTASIVSGAVIERIRLSAFLLLATVIGSIVWVIAASWGWHPAGWMLTELGFHDAGAAGCVHLIAGAFTLGVLINLGPRIGRFLPDGTPVTIRGHNLWMSMLGLMLIYVGFFGFMMGCVIYSGDGFLNIYGAPTNLSAWVFNMLMGLAGGLVGAYIVSKAEPFWCVSGGLAGVIAVAAGIDVYHPGLAFVIAVIGSALMVFVAGLIERAKIDDAVGAVAVHGAVGFWSLLAMGIFASGYPNVVGPDTSLGGQALGAVLFLALGFVPGWLVSKALALAGLLRVPPAVEVAGLDLSEIPASAYPEGVPPTPEPRVGLAASTNGLPAVAEPATT